MTPDEYDPYVRQVLDGLLKSISDMSITVARQDERIAANRGQIKAIRAEHQEDVEAIKLAVRDTGLACKARIDELEGAMKETAEKLEVRREQEAARLEARRTRNELTVPQKFMLASASFGPIIAAVALVVK